MTSRCLYRGRQQLGQLVDQCGGALWIRPHARLSEGSSCRTRDIAAGKKKLGDKLSIVHDPFKGMEGADVIYTDTWVSMGQDAERKKKLDLLKGYQVNDELISAAPPA